MLDGTPLSHAAHCGAPLSQAELGFRSWSAGLDFLALRALFRAASHTLTNRTGAGAHLAVLDVGANVGGGSLLLAEEFQQATVFSFEPQPLVRARLQRALSVANASHGYRFHVVPNAVSNVHGKAVPFYTPRTHSASDSFTGSGLAPRTGFSVTTSNSHTVTTVRIDSWCRAMGLTPSFVKIDTEGFDAFVLDGMDGLLASHTPRALIFELNPRLWPGAAKAMAADGRPHANVAPVASRVAEHRADRNRKVTLVDAAYSLSLHQLQYALEKYGYAVYMLSPRKLLRMHASCWQEQYAHWTATMNVVAVQRGKTEHGLVATYASVAGTLMPGAMRPSEPQAQAPQKKVRGLDAHAQHFPADTHQSYSRGGSQSHMLTHCPVSKLRVNTSHLDWVIVSIRGLCLTEIALRRLLFYFSPRRVFYITGRPADCEWIRAIDTRVVCVDEASYYSTMRMDELRVACASVACFPPANCSDPNNNLRPFGWYLQQFIKLGVSRYIADLSLRYVLWDADNMALFGKELLTHDGRVILQGNPRGAPYGYDEVYRTLVGERVPTTPSGIANWVVGYMVVDVRVARAMLAHMESRMHAPWPRCVCTALREVLDSANTGRAWFSEYQSYAAWLLSHQPHAVEFDRTALAYPRNPAWWHREAMRGKCCIEENHVCALSSGNREHFFAVIEEHKYRYRDSVCRDWQRAGDRGYRESVGKHRRASLP
jgi:FkbM family methyltransferase